MVLWMPLEDEVIPLTKEETEQSMNGEENNTQDLPHYPIHEENIGKI